MTADQELSNEAKNSSGERTESPRPALKEDLEMRIDVLAKQAADDIDRLLNTTLSPHEYVVRAPAIQQMAALIAKRFGMLNLQARDAEITTVG